MTQFYRLILFLCLTLFITACGKKGALIYPDMLIPSAPEEVTAHQSGSLVKLKFIVPAKDRAGHTINNISGFKISKRTNDLSQKDVCQYCKSDYSLFRTLYLDILPPDTQISGGLVVTLDNDVNEGHIYSYTVVSFTKDRVEGIASAAAEVRFGLPEAAPSIAIESFPTELKIHISSSAINNRNLFGYNIYRFSAKNPKSYQPINTEPVKSNEYIDNQLERGVTYKYTARELILKESGDISESLDSKEVEGMLKDDE